MHMHSNRYIRSNRNRFNDKSTLVWSPEQSVGTYDAYRERIGNVAGGGACWRPDLVGETASDGDAVPSRDGFFYLIAASNRLGENGTKGYDSHGSERAHAAPCP